MGLMNEHCSKKKPRTPRGARRAPSTVAPLSLSNVLTEVSDVAVRPPTIWLGGDLAPQQETEVGSPKALPNAADREILFALLSKCMPWDRAARATDRLFEVCGGMAEIVAASEIELGLVENIGPDVAAIIKCIRIAANRLLSIPIRNSPVLKNWEALEKYLYVSMARNRTEAARVLFLNTKNRLIADEVLWEGSINGVQVYARDVVKRALQLDATALILVHNHPSGDPMPSSNDVEMTREIQAAVDVMRIKLHDHIIVGSEGCMSFRRLGLL